MKRAMIPIALGAALALAPHARAEDAAGAAAAEALYLEGRALLDAGRVEPACQRLRDSQALDPGIGTMMLLGHCYELLGKTASAWATFRAVDSLAAAAKQADRAQIARVRAVALEPALVRLRIDLPPDVDATSWVVLRDEALVPVSAAGVAIPVDPGEHRVEIRVPSRSPWFAIVNVSAGAGVVPLQVPDLTPPRDARPSALDQPSKARSSGAPAVHLIADNGAPLRGAPESANGTRALPFVVGGAGVIAAGVGAAYGLWARSTYDRSETQCRTPRFCSAEGLKLRESAENKAFVSTLAFASGGALLAGGAVLWMLGGESHDRENQRAGSRLRTVALGAHVRSDHVVFSAGGEF